MTLDTTEQYRNFTIHFLKILFCCRNIFEEYSYFPSFCHFFQQLNNKMLQEVITIETRITQNLIQKLR